MGKDSLIKSTGNPSGTGKKKPAAGKKAAPKAAAAGTKKSGGAKTATAKAAAGNPAAEVTLKDLIFKKFDSQKPPAAGPPPAVDLSAMTAPPFIDSDDPREVARLRALLFQRYSMSDVQAAAKAPAAAEPPPAPEPAPESAPASGPPPEAAPAPGPAPAPEPPAAAAPEPTAAAAPEPWSRTGSGNGANGPQPDPVVRAARIGAAILALLAVLIIWSSFANRAKYYIVPEGDGIAVWQGIFSPTGKRLLAVLPALQPAEPLKEVYARNEVYPLIYTHYLASADALLQAGGLSDYPAIEGHLKAAQRYAADPTARAAVASRMDNLQRTRLIHQAHVEISKDTPESLAVALERLEQARRVAGDAVQLEAINQIVTLVNERRAELQSEGETAPAGE
jgi:colicin import membrane protein